MHVCVFPVIVSLRGGLSVSMCYHLAKIDQAGAEKFFELYLPKLELETPTTCAV